MTKLASYLDPESNLVVQSLDAQALGLLVQRRLGVLSREDIQRAAEAALDADRQGAEHWCEWNCWSESCELHSAAL